MQHSNALELPPFLHPSHNCRNQRSRSTLVMQSIKGSQARRLLETDDLYGGREEKPANGSADRGQHSVRIMRKIDGRLSTRVLVGLSFIAASRTRLWLASEMRIIGVDAFRVKTLITDVGSGTPQTCFDNR